MSKHDSLKLSSKGSVELMYYQTEPSLRQTMKNQRKKMPLESASTNYGDPW